VPYHRFSLFHPLFATFFLFLTIWIFCFRLQEGLAECIANEDGERQIACAISFHGEETASFLLLSPLQVPDIISLFTRTE